MKERALDALRRRDDRGLLIVARVDGELVEDFFALLAQLVDFGVDGQKLADEKAPIVLGAGSGEELGFGLGRALLAGDDLLVFGDQGFGEGAGGVAGHHRPRQGGRGGREGALLSRGIKRSSEGAARRAGGGRVGAGSDRMKEMKSRGGGGAKSQRRR